jgi:SagB-type dehydrogenase family enzyme
VAHQLWEQLRLPPNNDGEIWELFHENSKTSRYVLPLSDQAVQRQMDALWPSLPFVGYPVVNLPDSATPLNLSLAEAITTRVTARAMAPCSLSLEALATLLHYAYGVTRDNHDTTFPRPFRTVPSAGALYPLEIFFHSSHIEGLSAGLFHYNPTENKLRLLQAGDHSQRISEALVQTHLAQDAAAIFFITALFGRSTFKYGDRGYRFALLEAGHVAQNLNLVANGLGLGCINLGGFLDRQVDDFLGLDGLTHSTVYLTAIGEKV